MDSMAQNEDVTRAIMALLVAQTAHDLSVWGQWQAELGADSAPKSDECFPATLADASSTPSVDRQNQYVAHSRLQHLLLPPRSLSHRARVRLNPIQVLLPISSPLSQPFTLLRRNPLRTTPSPQKTSSMNVSKIADNVLSVTIGVACFAAMVPSMPSSSSFVLAAIPTNLKPIASWPANLITRRSLSSSTILLKL